MKLYIDSECRCHKTNPDGTFREVEHPFFDGKCDKVVEGYTYVPLGESHTKEDGTVLTGERIEPCKPCDQLAAAQAQYEADLAEASNAYQEGVESV